VIRFACAHTIRGLSHAKRAGLTAGMLARASIGAPAFALA